MRRPRVAPSNDPAAVLRSLIQEGLITSAALVASDDLSAAATSLHRLGTFTSGTWRALSRELAIAAERLDQQTQERLDSLEHRARALDIDPDAVIAAGMAAGHLEEHRQTFAAMLPTLTPDVRRLAGPDLLLGFTVDEEILEDEDEHQAGEAETAIEAEADALRLGVRIRLFLWPSPLTPVDVRVAPDLAEMALADITTELAVQIQVEADDATLDALDRTGGLSRERILPTLSTLGLACLSAHQLDERGEEEEEEEDADDLEPGDADA